MEQESDQATRLPPAHGATPRLETEAPPTRGVGYSESTFSAAVDDAQDLKMIHWYKLANEAAMKAALVKHKRFKEVPRLNRCSQNTIVTRIVHMTSTMMQIQPRC
jgi:hypothetical protein